MDLGKALVTSILTEGKSALENALAKGIGPNRLHGEGRDAFTFLADYVQKFGVLPLPQQILGKTGILLDGSDTFTFEDVPPKSSAWFIDEVNNLHLHMKMQEGLKLVVELQEKRQPQQAYTELEKLLGDLRTEQIGLSSVESLFKLGPEVKAFYEKIKAGERGILTPWDKINDITLGFWPEDLVLFVARVGVGKCLVNSTILYDPETGVPHTIEDVFNRVSVAQTTSWSKTDGVHVRRITAKHDTGRKRCLRVTLGTGRSVIVTPEHPFLTPEGWRKAEDLVGGASIALPCCMPHPHKPVAIPSHHVDVLALMLADGSCRSNDTRFTKQAPAIVDLGREIASAFGVKLVACDEGRDWRFSTGYTGGKSNPVREVLRDHGLLGCLSRNKTIPEAIFRLPAAQLARFLGVFFSCDGYIDRGAAGVTLASETLVRQLQSLLLRFGVQSSVHYKQAKNQDGVFDAWRLRVHSQCSDTFYKEITLIGEKRGRLEAALSQGTRRNANVGFPRFTREGFKKLKAISGAKGFKNPNAQKYRIIEERLGLKSPFTPKQLFNKRGDFYAAGLRGLQVYAEEFGVADEYKWLWDSDIFWDTIDSIEGVGEKKIYDLTVEPTQCFVANDVIVHNTWTAVLLALHAWKTPKPKTGAQTRVLFITTEVSRMRIGMRFYAAMERLPYGEFTHGRLDGFTTEPRFYKAVEELYNAEGLYIIGGDFDFQIESVAAAIETCKPDLVVLDGVYLLRVQGANRNERMANAFDEMKRLAKRKHVPIIITTQFNREVKKDMAKTVQVESIALSDVGAWNADLIFGLVQSDDMKAEKKMTFKALKVREGAEQDVTVNWNFDRMDFTELVSSGGQGGDADEFGVPKLPTDPSGMPSGDPGDMPF